MTDDEKRQQKANLLLEYHEAEENLAHLREKARHIAWSIEEVSKWLGDAYQPSEYHQGRTERNPRIRAALDEYRKAMNFDAVMELVDEVTAAEEVLRELSKRKVELGLK